MSLIFLLLYFSAGVNRTDLGVYLSAEITSCLRNELAAFWSLYGKTTLIGTSC